MLTFCLSSRNWSRICATTGKCGGNTSCISSDCCCRVWSCYGTAPFRSESMHTGRRCFPFGAARCPGEKWNNGDYRCTRNLTRRSKELAFHPIRITKQPINFSLLPGAKLRHRITVVIDDPLPKSEVAQHPYRLLFATISGAHLYGFASLEFAGTQSSLPEVPGAREELNGLLIAPRMR